MPSRRGGRRLPTSRSRRTAGARSRGRRPEQRVDGARAGAPRPRRPQGRRRRRPLAHAPRVDPARLGDHVDRRRRRRALPDEHRHRSARTSSGTPRPSSPSPRTRHSARSSRRCSAQLPQLREIVGFEELAGFTGEGGVPEDVHEDDLATLIYTSGTTGPPKGCMLSHKNLTTAALRVKTHIEGTTDTVLLFLPMAHSFARICHQSATYRGATLALCADATRVPEALARVRPTILPAVPRVYEKVHANALGEIERASGAKRAIGRWALRVGSRASARRRSGRPLPLAAARPARARGQAGLLEGACAARRPAASRRLGRGAAERRGARVLPLARTCS